MPTTVMVRWRRLGLRLLACANDGDDMLEKRLRLKASYL